MWLEQPPFGDPQPYLGVGVGKGGSLCIFNRLACWLLSVDVRVSTSDCRTIFSPPQASCLWILACHPQTKNSQHRHASSSRLVWVSVFKYIISDTMLLLLVNKVALNRRGAFQPLNGKRRKPSPSLHLPVNGSWQRRPWFCCQCSGNVSVVELFHMSPRRAELAGRIAITLLLLHRAGGPASLTPHFLVPVSIVL